MVDKVSSGKPLSQVDKKKKTSGAKGVSGPSFDSFIQNASSAEEVQETTPTTPVSPVMSGLYGSNQQMPEDVPTEPRERGSYLLDRLQELEQAVLSGEEVNIAKLKEAMATETIGKEDLPPALQKALDEIDLRVAVEVAKMEEGDKQNNN